MSFKMHYLFFTLIIAVSVLGQNDTQSSPPPPSVTEGGQAVDNTTEVVTDADTGTESVTEQDSPSTVDSSDSSSTDSSSTDSSSTDSPSSDPSASDPSSLGPSSSDSSSLDLSSSGSELDDVDFLAKFEEVAQAIACKYMGVISPEELKLNLSRPTTLEDITKLTFLVKGNKLRTQKLKFPGDISWRREVVDVLYKIFTSVCPNAFVKHEYMKIMRELTMIYLNSVEPRTTGNPELWPHFMSEMTTCASQLKTPYVFSSSGLLIDKLLVREAPQAAEATSGMDDDGNEIKIPSSDEESSEPVNEAKEQPEEEQEQSETEAEPTEPAEPERISLTVLTEHADRVFVLHPVIDTFWKIFSHAWGICLPNVPSKELWGPRFKQLFFQEFLAPLQVQWATGNQFAANLGLVVGDFDVERMNYNLDFCLQAAYYSAKNERSQQYQLIRPLMIGDANGRISNAQNNRL